MSHVQFVEGSTYQRRRIVVGSVSASPRRRFQELYDFLASLCSSVSLVLIGFDSCCGLPSWLLNELPPRPRPRPGPLPPRQPRSPRPPREPRPPRPPCPDILSLFKCEFECKLRNNVSLQRLCCWRLLLGRSNSSAFVLTLAEKPFVL